MRGTSNRWRQLLALLAILAIVAAACGDDDGGDSATGDEGTEEGTDEGTDGDEPVTGGTLVVAAEQEPECADWISACAGASWGVWTMSAHTMPRVYEQVDGDYIPSVTMAGEPVLEVGDDGTQVVTYAIADDAVWSDGTPITSTDIKYTWHQIANGADIYDPTGYVNIASVDDSDPKVAVVTFETPFAAWKDLFGGFYGIFPKHILCGEDTAVEDCSGDDRNAAMNDGYDWSGGPWFAEWNKGTNVTLTPNPTWNGPAPLVDEVVFQFIEDTTQQINALKAGEVAAANPQPQLELGAQLGGEENLVVQVNPLTTFLEAFWINMAAPPFDEKAVRQAFAYALDRDAVVAALFGDLGVTEASQSLIPGASAAFVTDAFAIYTRDLAKVDELMTGAGWAKNADGFWEKDGVVAAVPIATTEGNQRRATTQDAVKSMLEEAGFAMTADNSDPATLFGERGPASDFTVSLWATVATQTPQYCGLFCSKNIPSEENDFGGQNWTQTLIPELDEILGQAEVELDEATRIGLYADAQDIMADEAISIPLDPLPEIAIYDSNVVCSDNVGPNPVFSLYWNLYEWELC